MVDLIEFKLNANDKISSSYINDENFNVCFLDNINKVNILIGKNNSGKSRFMRNIINENYNFYQINNDSNILIKIEDFVRDYKNRYTYDCLMKDCMKELEGYEEKDVKEVISILFRFYFLSLNNSDFHVINFNHAILRIIELLENVKQEIIYIPILRGIEKFRNTVDSFSADKDSFRLTKGERISLDNYIKQVDNIYFNKVLKNYFKPSKVSFTNIHTGENMYNEIQQKLLGSEKNRKEIKEYETFLSKNFFENKSINLIPNITTNYLYINIDGEEHELHNLGEGIKQLIIITYKMFTQKEQPSLFFIEEPELNLHPRTSKKIDRINVK